jgi:enoyl-CoA hydratase/carnithine racemase
VTVRTQGNVAHVVLDDGHGNALGSASLCALAAAVDVASRADAVVLTGRPRIFCGGLDLDEIADLSASALKDFLGLLYTTRRALFALERPLVVAVAGSAIGAGAALLCCGDQRLGALDQGRVGLTEAALGVPPEITGLVIARSVLGVHAEPALMFGDALARPEAHDVGFFLRLTAPDALLQAAADEAQRRCAVSRAAGLIKRELRRSGLRWMEQERAANHASFVAAWTGAAAQVLIQAARQQVCRKPVVALAMPIAQAQEQRA